MDENQKSDKSGHSYPIVGGIHLTTDTVRITPPEIRFSDAAFLRPKRSSMGSTRSSTVRHTEEVKG